MMENLQLLGDSTTKLDTIASTWGIDARALNRPSMLEILMYLTLVFIL